MKTAIPVSTPEQLSREMFFSRPETGTIIAGIKHVFNTETHECYQFYSVEEIVATVKEYQAISEMQSLKVVTYKVGTDKNHPNKILYKWQRS